MIHLDTHVAVWLHIPRVDLMSRTAIHVLEHEELALSPVAVLELQYLNEIGRLHAPAAELVDELRRQLGVTVLATAFDQVARAAMAQHWTRDPFDRLIVGHAIALDRPLLTADDRIREHVVSAVW